MAITRPKFLLHLLLLGSSLITAVEGATAPNIMDLFPLIPSCALPCLIQAAAKSTETMLDPASLCRDVPLQASISQCLQTACNHKEQSEVGIVYARFCADVPIEDGRKWSLFIVSVIFGPLALVAIALRTYSRHAITKEMGADDWTTVAAGGIMVGILTVNYLNLFRNGFGRHYWNIDPLRVEELLQMFFAVEILYILEVTLVKVSILLFYLRVFPSRSFRVATILTMTLVVAACIATLIPILVQCNPIIGAWDRTIADAKCININLLAYAQGGIGVGLDVIIIALPIPRLLKLQMNYRKKAHVLFMFSLGSIACVTSMIRLKYLADFTNSTDQTWDNTLPSIWSLVEICIAIICACLPSIRAPLVHHMPCLFGSEVQISSEAYYNNRASTQPDTYANAASGQVVISRFSTQSGGNQTFITSTLSNEEKGIPLDPLTSPSTNYWFSKRAFSTYKRARDLEHQPREADSFTQALEVSNTTSTMTTKIWVDSSTSSNLDWPSWPKRAQSVSVNRHTHQTSHFEPLFLPSTTRNSEDRANESTDKILEPRISRDGSEESIFALEGPRVSDSYSRDERQREFVLERLDFQTGTRIEGLGFDGLGFLGRDLARRSGTDLSENFSSGASTIRPNTTERGSTIRSGSSTGLINNPPPLPVGERERISSWNGQIDVAVAVRVGSRSRSAMGIGGLAGSGMFARTVETLKRPSSAAGGRNRSASVGRLRSSSSFGLGGREMRIPLSRFSTFRDAW